MKHTKTEDDFIKKWGEEHGISGVEWLAENGESRSYTSNSNKTIVITTNKMRAALQSFILNNNDSHLPDVSIIKKTNPEQFIFVSEELSDKDVDAVFESLEMEAELQNCEILDVNEKEAFLPKLAIKGLRDLKQSEKSFNRFGGIGYFDVSKENIGINKHKNFVFKEQKGKSLEFNLDHQLGKIL